MERREFKYRQDEDSSIRYNRPRIGRKPVRDGTNKTRPKR